jgi:ferritin-like metal-binding protein YciE
MSVTNTQQLFEHELRDIYYAEQKLVQALGQLASESINPQAQQAFTQHQTETQNHVRRLEQVFQLLGQTPQAQTCQGIEGLIKEKQAFAKENPTPEILQIFNIGAGEKSEHYEISAYEGMISLAQQIGQPQVVQLLQQNLQEEQAALQKLKSIAQSMNPHTSAGSHRAASSANAG